MLSSALVMIDSWEKKESEYMCSDWGHTLSVRDIIFWERRGFIWIAEAAATFDFGCLRCFSRNKN